MAPPLIVTVLLNTSRREDTLAALASLEQSTYDNYRVIVLDNSSTDGSVEAIYSAFPSVQFIQLEKNLGYAGNNNVGIKAAVAQGADWVFVLNEDTIIANDCLTRLIEAGKSNPKIGIVGPMVYHNNEPNVIQSAGGMLSRYWQSWHIAQNEQDQGQVSQTHFVDWISGCAILVRRETIDQIGGLDERFFYYWEETEWCVRARKYGWLILHVPLAKLWHKGVQRDYHPNPNVTYYATRNHFLMMAKHRAPISAWIMIWGQTLRTLLSWSLKPKWRDMRPHRDAMWQGTIDFLRHHWGMRSV